MNSCVAAVETCVETTRKHLKITSDSAHELASAMEFVLDALHQCSKIAKDEVNHVTAYKDMVGSIFTGKGINIEEEEL